MAPSSMYGSRSTTSIASARSRNTIGTVTHSLAGSRKTKPKWHQRRPIIRNALFTDLQKGSYLVAIYTLVESMIQIALATFDTYCLAEARPGSTHFRSFGISFLFVYSGNEHIRRSLIACSVMLFFSAVYLLGSSIILMAALRKEHEIKFKHWLRSMGIFTVLRVITIFFQSIVNDLYFAYHQAMLIIWFLFTGINVFAWLIVYSNYQELGDITRLEDMAKLKMSTLSSLNASRSLSHHSLDSYRGTGTVNSHPSPNVSIHGHNMLGTPRGSTASAHSYTIQPSPKTDFHQPSTSSIPLAAYGLNFNPNGNQPSPRSQGSLTSASYGRGSTPSTAPI